MKAQNEDRMAVELVDAEAVFDEEYTPGSATRGVALTLLR